MCLCEPGARVCVHVEDTDDAKQMNETLKKSEQKSMYKYMYSH